MARQAVDVQIVNSSGIVGNYTTIGVDGVEFNNAKNVFLHFKATTAATVTIATPLIVNSDLQVDDRIITLASGEEKFVGPFSKNIYEFADGTIQVDSDQTDTDVAALRMV